MIKRGSDKIKQLLRNDLIGLPFQSTYIINQKVWFTFRVLNLAFFFWQFSCFRLRGRSCSSSTQIAKWCLDIFFQRSQGWNWNWKGNLAFKIAALAKMNFYMTALINLEWSEISNFLNKQIQNIIWKKGTSKSLENNRGTTVFHYHM